MTFAEIADRHAPAPEIIGPYSTWPRRPRRKGVRGTAVAVSAVAAGVAIHCGLPLLF